MFLLLFLSLPWPCACLLHLGALFLLHALSLVLPPPLGHDQAFGLDTLHGGLGPGVLVPGEGLPGISWTVT